jgi:two-component system, OmpR family, sensor histidine kinase MtrB
VDSAQGSVRRFSTVPMRKAPLSLNTLLSWVMVSLALLVSCTCASIFLATSQLRHVSATIDDAVQSVHSAEQAALELLIFDRASTTPIDHQAAERRLRERLSDARRYVSSPTEASVLQEATSAVDDYLAISLQSPRDPARIPPFRRSYDAISRLVDINLAQARDSQVDAARIDRIAEGLGIALGLLVLLVLGALVLWLRTRAFAGVFRLGKAMDQFEDDRDARAPETGPLELREMARSFNRMADTISRRRQQQITFLAGVAHDLRNPLAALRTSLAVIGPDRPLPPEPTIRRIAELMDRQFDHLERMTGDFIDTARIEAGELELRAEPRDLADLVRHVVTVLQTAPWDERFQLTVPAEPVVVFCDGARIQQVVTNLLSNAMKYSSEASAIRVTLVAHADQVALSVADHGIGIAPGDLPTIFDPFRRGEAARRTTAGVGLGLFVARRIVRAHGGRLEVESAPGAGSTFRVVLPRLAKIREPAAWGTEPARAAEAEQDILS